MHTCIILAHLFDFIMQKPPDFIARNRRAVREPASLRQRYHGAGRQKPLFSAMENPKEITGKRKMCHVYMRESEVKRDRGKDEGSAPNNMVVVDKNYLDQLLLQALVHSNSHHMTGGAVHPTNSAIGTAPHIHSNHTHIQPDPTHIQPDSTHIQPNPACIPGRVVIIMWEKFNN